MDKPFAITLDVGSSLANKTGSWRTSRPVYLDRLPPCNNACPAGENIQAWLFHAEGGDYEAAWRELTQNNPLPAVMGRVCYHPCEDSCNRGKLDAAVGINSVERFLGDEAIKRGWTFPAPPKESGKRVLVVGAGPSGLSAAYHLRRLGHAVKVVEAGPLAGGMMRFGIPKYRLPRDVLDAEVKRIADLGVEFELQPQGRQHPRHDEGRPLRRGVPRRRRPHRQARVHSRRRGGEDARRRVGAARHGRRGKADARSPRRHLRRRQHGARRRPHRQAAGRLRGDHRLPAQPREDARARLRGRGGAAGRRDDQVAVDDQEHGQRGHADRREDEARREGLPAADRRVRDPRGRFAGAGARPGRRPVAARGRAGTRDQGRHRAGLAEHDDRLPRHLRRRRHGALGAHGDRRRRPRQEGGPQHRRLAARAAPTSRRRSTSSPTSRSSMPGTTPTRRRPCGRCSTSCAGRRPSTRW